MAGDVGVYAACLGAGWYLVMLAISTLGVLVARSRYRSPGRPPRIPPDASSLPGVSILRPLRGLDCNLFENLEASLAQEYPSEKVEIIFSVASEDDQAISVVRELLDKYPGRNARLIVGEERVGVNPKINNLIRSYREAKHDILWVLDSNTLVLPSTLLSSVALLTAPPSSPKAKPIGLVHHVPFAILPSTELGSRLEQVFLNTTHAKMYLAINATGIDSCLMGKSNLFRRSDLERATQKLAQKKKWMTSPDSSNSKDGEGRPSYGALAAYAKFLGEDNMIGHTLWHQLDVRHAMTSDVAGNAVGWMDLKTYFWRRVRWIRVRKYMVTASTLAEPFTEAVVLAVIASLSFRRLLGIPYLLSFFGHLILSFCLDVSVSNSLTCASPNPLRDHNVAHDGPGVAFLRAWLAREFLALPIWVYAMLGNRAGWRDDGRQYRVLMSGEVEEVGEHEGDGWTERLLQRFLPSFDRQGRNKGYVPLESEPIA